MVLMKHQAGGGNVGKWSNYWEKFDSGKDLEFRIETARFSATANFVRRALRDTAIVDAAGIFED